MRKKLLFTTFMAGLLSSVATQAQTTLYGITAGDSIFTMANVNAPSSISGPYAVSGIAAGQVLAGLDARPSNGALYALGYDSVTQMAQLYIISASGTVYNATAVSGSMAAMALGTTNNIAFDFVSTADSEIRVIARNGNNYVMNAVTGAVMSTGVSGLTFAAGDLYSGLTSALAATAYTNSFYGADATTEVGYDAVNNVLVKMNAGTFLNGFLNTSNTLNSIGATTGVTFATGGSIGMDALYDSTTHTNTIYMTGNTLLSGAHLYSYALNSVTGTLTDLGAIGTGTMNVREIAFGALNAFTGAVSQKVMGLSLNLRKLISFDAINPSHITNAVSLSGITTGQSMVGIDYSESGTLYGLGYNSGSQTYQLYTIDTMTGVATAVNASPLLLNLGTDDGSGNYVNAAMRFISTATNGIRVIGNNGAVNVIMNAATGVITATDTAVKYITGDVSFGATANITSIAYTGYGGDTATQLFGFDANSGAVVMFDKTDLSGGMGNGSSGDISTDISVNSILSLFGHTTTYNNAYMNMAYDVATMSNIGFMASDYFGDSATNQENFGMMYSMTDMLTAYGRGTAVAAPTPVGTIGYGTPVKDIAIRRSAINTGITNVAHNAASSLLVYPNPVTDVTHIILPAASPVVVSVYVIDLNGSVDQTYHYAPGTTTLDINMNVLPTGVYSVRVFDPNVGNYNLKVVKE